MEVVILCGGQGMRLRDLETQPPKPLHTIGGIAILFHIFQCFARYNHTEFILATGYGHQAVWDYCKGYAKQEIADGFIIQSPLQPKEDYEVRFAQTPVAAETGARLRGTVDKIRGQRVMMTYCDGLANTDLTMLQHFFEAHDCSAVLTAVQPPPRYGELRLDHRDSVTEFHEKDQQYLRWINGGFFILDTALINNIAPGEDVSFEQDVLPQLAHQGELKAFRHHGFWACMDTQKERQMLEKLWASKQVPWLS